ncbi:hypothetical protein [Actinoplanes campanulatus]|uniref:8-oxoguanine DNA glycosylase OGG fold protein n=1 Tax=Actinoplanes campanulatus TaxID=113559 RepID=UPI0019539128|nr:hypothetical protein [Actinoplanes capillaceus]
MPNPLRVAFRRWDSGGRQGQEGMRWNRSTWQATVPEHHGLLSSLPERLDRTTVATWGAGAADGEAQAVQAFIAAMVWGYGPAGYGAYRAARVLRENPQAPAVLCEVAQVVRRDGGAEAFAWLREHRLRRLGVAFATKYLFFCNGPDAPPALILDRLVQRWLLRHADLQVRLDWHVGDYTRYLEMTYAWANELGVTPDCAEYLMFSDMLAEEPGRSPWAPRQVAASIVVEGAEDDEAGTVLEAIDDAAATFAALPNVTPGDLEDFERGIRQLRRIVLARID